MEPRRATAQDVEAVTALVRRAFERYIERIGVRPGPMDADFAGHAAAGRLWVLDDGARIVGCVVLEPYDGWLEVDDVAVEPTLHGQGLGRLLLDFAEAQAAALGLPEMRLSTNVKMTENQRIYPHLGWTAFHRGTSPSGFERIYYRKPVSPAAAAPDVPHAPS